MRKKARNLPAFCDKSLNHLKLSDWLAGAGGIEPCNNPLPHKDFPIPARPFDSIFDAKAKALVGMTDEVAGIEAKGWKASVVPEPSIIHTSRTSVIKRRSFAGLPSEGKRQLSCCEKGARKRSEIQRLARKLFVA